MTRLGHSRRPPTRERGVLLAMGSAGSVREPRAAIEGRGPVVALVRQAGAAGAARRSGLACRPDDKKPAAVADLLNVLDREPDRSHRRKRRPFESSGPGNACRHGVGGCHAAGRCMDRAAQTRMAAWTRVVRGGGLRTSRVLVVRSGWRVMTREQLVRAEAIALADARRMASALAATQGPPRGPRARQHRRALENQ